jgi:hypothetical protein
MSKSGEIKKEGEINEVASKSRPLLYCLERGLHIGVQLLEHLLAGALVDA